MPKASALNSHYQSRKPRAPKTVKPNTSPIMDPSTWPESKVPLDSKVCPLKTFHSQVLSEDNVNAKFTKSDIEKYYHFKLPAKDLVFAQYTYVIASFWKNPLGMPPLTR
jgi:hypothetical protein